MFLAVARRARLRSPRPGFMAITVLVALAAAPVVGWLAENLYDERAARAAALEDADQAVREEMLELGWQPLAVAHGIELLTAGAPFSVELAGGAVRGVAPDADARTAAALVVSEELARYPRELLQAARLRRVLLCRELHEGETAIPSLPNFHRTLLLDVDADREFLRRLVHHEVFHFADYADDDQVQRDPAWARLNDHWFVYGSGGRFARDPKSSRPSDTLPGFVTSYAQSALEEDKAETFAFFMVDRTWLERRAERDPVIEKKLAAVERQLLALSPSAQRLFQ